MHGLEHISEKVEVLSGMLVFNIAPSCTWFRLSLFFFNSKHRFAVCSVKPLFILRQSCIVRKPKTYRNPYPEDWL